MSANALGFSNVHLTMGTTRVFEGVNLEIPLGSSVVLLGPSGQGKTCLLKLMAGLLPPESGKVHVGGQDLYSLNFSDRARHTRNMGMLFQKNALFDSLTVFENVAFPLREILALGENEISRQVSGLLEAVELAGVSRLMPHEISGGMQKRLGIARALALNPQIIFYDDPTAGLDPITSRKIVALIQKFHRESGSTQILVTNDMNRAYELSTQIYMVVDRELIYVGDRKAAESHSDPRVQQFIRGQLHGPLKAV